jgi:ribA/ribD-fused uncharacterized protein
MKLTLDNDKQIFFYEQDYYILSNFSSFTLKWKGIRFDTSESAYHWEKFKNAPEIQIKIIESSSAHEAFKISEIYKDLRRKDWDDVKLNIMKEILKAKVEQHEYVKRKLLATENKELIENSWRDGFWGWGEDRKGKNWLGKLWMEIRNELKNEKR